MRRHRKKTILIPLFFVILFLTGCVNADYHVTIHKDGSGTYRMKVLTQPMIADELASFQEKLESNDYQVQEIHEGDLVGWVAEKKVDNVTKDPPGQDLKDAFSTSGKSASLFPLPEEKSTGPVRIEKSWFQYRILLRTDADLTTLKADNPVEQFLWDETNLRLRLTLPLKPEEHNADKVSEDGKTLTWMLDPGEKNPVQVLVTLPNPVGWILTFAGIFILLIIPLLWLFYRFLKSRRQGDKNTI